VLAVVLIGSALFKMTAATAEEHPRLPARTAAQLLTALQHDNGQQSFSGSVKTSPKLGLPSIPDSFGSGAGFSLQSLLTESQRFRVWADGPERQRLALIGDMAENDVIHNGNDQTAASDEATAPTPAAASNEFLKALDPTTAVTVDRTARVAGRSAYQLVLQPRDSRTLVRKVLIALDSKTMLPLRLRVVGSRSTTKPAYEVAFTSISFHRPSASTFTFRVPHGATVGPMSLSTFAGSPETRIAKGTRAPITAPGETASSGTTRTIGTGWTAVLVYTPGSTSVGTLQMLDRVATHTPAGGLISTALVSVLIANNGSIYVGAVPGSALQTVAATGHGL
jgi:outer membrane lipoprotein-sorting protein